jgi:hypothetical protein
MKTVLSLKGGEKEGYTQLGNNEQLVNLMLLTDTTLHEYAKYRAPR